MNSAFYFLNNSFRNSVILLVSLIQGTYDLIFLYEYRTHARTHYMILQCYWLSEFLCIPPVLVLLCLLTFISINVSWLRMPSYSPTMRLLSID